MSFFGLCGCSLNPAVWHPSFQAHMAHHGIRSLHELNALYESGKPLPGKYHSWRCHQPDALGTMTEPSPEGGSAWKPRAGSKWPAERLSICIGRMHGMSRQGNLRRLHREEDFCNLFRFFGGLPGLRSRDRSLIILHSIPSFESPNLLSFSQSIPVSIYLSVYISI